MKVRELIRLLEHDGWALVGQEGSHRQFKHAMKAVAFSAGVHG